MRALFCCYDWPDHVSGPNSWVKRLLPNLRERGVDAGVLIIGPRGVAGEALPTLRALKERGIWCRLLPTAFQGRTNEKVCDILDAVGKYRPEVFVPNLVIPAYFAIPYLKKAGIPTVGVLHSDDPFHHALIDAFVCGAPEMELTGLVCVSRYLEELTFARSPDRTVVRCIPCGAPLPGRRALLPSHSLKLVYTGRLEQEQKRILDLTRALCLVTKAIPQTEAVIYGNGNAKQEVQRILETEGRGLPVRLGGVIDSDQMQEELLRHHVIVLLSDYEGIPISLMEAMACGLVPITLKIASGIPELVEDRVTGLMVSDRGPSFLRAVRELKENPESWSRLSHGARGRVEEGYSDTGGAQSWAAFLSELSQGGGPRCQVAVPRRIRLPSPRPEFAREDFRVDPCRRGLVRRVVDLFC